MSVTAALSQCLHLLIANLTLVLLGTGFIAYILIVVVLFRNRNKAPLNNNFYRMATSLGFADIIGRLVSLTYYRSGAYPGGPRNDKINTNKSI